MPPKYPLKEERPPRMSALLDVVSKLNKKKEKRKTVKKIDRSPVVRAKTPDISSGIQNKALSIRQPYAEMILRGIKKIEYRTMRTNIRGRVYIYASLTAGPLEEYEKLKSQPGDFPTGVLVGTVEIIGCETPDGYDYEWLLTNPERLEKPITADNKAQPSWLIPFKQ
jgi:hypothetical protein